MRISLLIALTAVIAAVTARPRPKRQVYDLPAGAELLLGDIISSFHCIGDGYYADVDNDCKIFHVCHTMTHADGYREMRQYSFFCGNQTVFNQLSFTCAHEEEAVPCQNAPDFYYLNGNIGDDTAPFLVDDDMERGANAIAAKKGRGPVALVGPTRGPPQPVRPFGSRIG